MSVLCIEVTGVVGLYTNPRHVMAYDDGEVRQQFSICFTTRLLGGELRTSSETKEVRFVPPAQLDELNIRQRDATEHSPFDAATHRALPSAASSAVHRLSKEFEAAGDPLYRAHGSGRRPL